MRVLIATDSPARAKRVRSMLSAKDVRIVGVTTPAALLNDPQKPADVVILDRSLDGRDEPLFDALWRLGCPTLICTEPVDTPTLRWALGRGVSGVVWNSRLDETLRVTARAVSKGQLVFPGELRRTTTHPELTNREKQALSLVIMGLTNHEIADRLYVSESTVKSHLNSAYRKIGVGSRAEAAERITDPEEGLGTGILAIGPAEQIRVRRRSRT